MSANAIEQTLALAERILPRRRESQHRLIVREAKKSAALLDGLLGIEESARETIKKHLVALKLRREQVEAPNFTAISNRYPRLSLEPLTWRDENGWPRLVVFDLSSPHCEFALSGRPQRVYSTWNGEYRGMRLVFHGKMLPKLPKVIAACYDDVFERMRKEARKSKKSLKFSCRFEGLIPCEVKEKIVEARKLFDGNIFLVAEPKNFVLGETAIVVPKCDPLVVGFDGYSFWLIADFDTTPVEEYIKAEFCVKASEN